MKTCTSCGILKPLSEYHTDNSTKDKYSYSCKVCRCASTKRSQEKRRNTSDWKVKEKAKNIKYTYGLDYAEFLTKLKQQDSKCPICNSNLSLESKTINIDHNHITGKVRGLLCFNCNVGLGNFKENVAALQNAISYLNIYNENP